MAKQILYGEDARRALKTGIDALTDAKIPATVIGRAVECQKGCRLTGPDGARPLLTFARDEIARLFE